MSSHKRTEPGSPWSLFEKGAYADLLRVVRAPGKTSEETAALIGALSFSGRLEEALEIWRLRGATLAPEFRRRSRFTLAATATRLSRFKLAVRLLRENRADGTTKDFYVCQGIAFHSYYRGRFGPARLWAKRALRAALDDGSGFMRLLALDLLAHATSQLGETAVALRLFGEGQRVAKDRGDAGIGAAMRVSSLLLQNEIGLRPESNLRDLENEFRETKNEEFYVRTNLMLELSRQWTLRGRFLEAKRLLDREALQIYSFGNRRQEMTLQLRLAEIAFQQGDASACAHFIRSAERCLNRIADRAFELRVLGMEKKLFERLLGRPFSESKMRRLLSLSEEHPDRLNDQILSRGGEIAKKVGSDDPLHRVFIEMRASPEKARRGLGEHGYWGLWAQTWGLAPGVKAFVFQREEPRVVLVSPEVVRPLEGLGIQSRKLLQRLHQGLATKEDLIRSVWGYAYDPLRHDPLIYAALSSLRKILGEQAAWLETRDDGWRLQTGLVWQDADENETAPVPGFVRDSADLPADLSVRQFRALQAMDHRVTWEVRSYRDFFQISAITAFRDLDDLSEKGYLQRNGKGRATCYFLAGRTE